MIGRPSKCRVCGVEIFSTGISGRLPSYCVPCRQQHEKARHRREYLARKAKAVTA